MNHLCHLWRLDSTTYKRSTLPIRIQWQVPPTFGGSTPRIGKVSMVLHKVQFVTHHLSLFGWISFTKISPRSITGTRCFNIPPYESVRQAKWWCGGRMRSNRFVSARSLRYSSIASIACFLNKINFKARGHLYSVLNVAIGTDYSNGKSSRTSDCSVQYKRVRRCD
jgi:hypothetical protein